VHEIEYELAHRVEWLRAGSPCCVCWSPDEQAVRRGLCDCRGAPRRSLHYLGVHKEGDKTGARVLPRRSNVEASASTARRQTVAHHDAGLFSGAMPNGAQRYSSAPSSATIWSSSRTYASTDLSDYDFICSAKAATALYDKPRRASARDGRVRASLRGAAPNARRVSVSAISILGRAAASMRVRGSLLDCYPSCQAGDHYSSHDRPTASICR